MIVSDIHGSLKDETACNAAIACAKDFKPDIGVIAGDLFDFAAIRKGASLDEQSISMRDDFDMGIAFASEFFATATDRHFMLGNHDVRAWDMMETQDAVRKDLGERMVSDIKQKIALNMGAKIYPYDARAGVMSIGHLKVIHGFHTGVSAASLHARAYGNVVYGHAHSIESYNIPSLDQREARCIGCLCGLNPDYANRKTGKLRWAHGWAMGYVNDDGTYSLFQVRGIDGKFAAPTDIKEY